MSFHAAAPPPCVGLIRFQTINYVQKRDKSKEEEKYLFPLPAAAFITCTAVNRECDIITWFMSSPN
jgi:hypothetical protein